MASTWPTGTCGYCGAEETVRYECSTCKRSGCPTCMPDGETKRCPYCDKNLWATENGHRRHVDI